MSLQKDLDDLVSQGIITTETAGRIENFYRRKNASPQNRLFVVFGILGALLVGMGIVLIIAHNWDELSNFTKTLLAFLPLVGGQALAGYALWKKPESQAWREGSAVFLFLSIAACISLISQIYNIPGELGGFLLTWCVLGLPIIYLMNSPVVSLLYLGGITWYACEQGYWSGASSSAHYYWLLLLLALPFYYRLFRHRAESNFTTFHHYIVPLSLIISLGLIAIEQEVLMLLAYSSLFGLLYLLGNSTLLRNLKRRNNGYLVLGSLGTISLLLALSFEWLWTWISEEKIVVNDLLVAPEFYATLIMSLAGVVVLAIHWKQNFDAGTALLESAFFWFIITFVIGNFSPVAAMVLTNLLVLGLGLQIVRKGARQDHLGVLNYGLLIIAALIICRFFDTNLTFVMRGVLFIGVGAGFFMVNYMTLKRRRANEA